VRDTKGRISNLNSFLHDTLFVQPIIILIILFCIQNICRRNLLFTKSLYRSSAASVPYSLPNTHRDRKSICCGLRTSGEREVSKKKKRTTTDLSNTSEHRGCQTVRFAVSQALCTQTSIRPWHLKSFCSLNSSPRPPLPSLQDGRCSRTYTIGLG